MDKDIARKLAAAAAKHEQEYVATNHGDIIHTKDGRKWDDSDIETVEVRGEEIIIKKAEGLASDSENEVAIRELEN